MESRVSPIRASDSLSRSADVRIGFSRIHFLTNAPVEHPLFPGATLQDGLFLFGKSDAEDAHDMTIV